MGLDRPTIPSVVGCMLFNDMPLHTPARPIVTVPGISRIRCDACGAAEQVAYFKLIRSFGAMKFFKLSTRLDQELLFSKLPCVSCRNLVCFFFWLQAVKWPRLVHGCSCYVRGRCATVFPLRIDGAIHTKRTLNERVIRFGMFYVSHCCRSCKPVDPQAPVDERPPI